MYIYDLSHNKIIIEIFRVNSISCISIDIYVLINNIQHALSLCIATHKFLNFDPQNSQMIN